MDPAGVPVPFAATAAPVGLRARAATLAAGVAATAYIALVDPARGGAYPLCPSRVLLGIDCPACGGLRGTHDLLHGHLGRALDHNLLLPAYLGVIAVMAGLWLLPLVGRPAPALHLPRWLAVAALVVVAAFTVARNLPIDGLRFLDSAA